ncbi:MAG: CopK family periplasmic copper-binding protein [Sulfuritalea sp.]|nr:CopK family periplasmic copper-binding protein [Sulfuritalea sp.]
MKTKLVKLALIAVLSTAGATTAFAHDAARAEAKQMIELKNGSTLYVFKDGKMALEDRYGRATRIGLGAVVEAKDGRQIKMESDEVGRLDSLINEGHISG